MVGTGQKRTGFPQLADYHLHCPRLARGRGSQTQSAGRTDCHKDVRSPERLLDETALLLHRNAAKLPDKQRKMLETLHRGALEGKKVLIVDDDIRNMFAMTSVVERFKMNVVSAENGKD